MLRFVIYCTQMYVRMKNHIFLENVRDVEEFPGQSLVLLVRATSVFKEAKQRL